MAAEKLVSLLPSEMVQGGLIDDLDVVFESAGFVLYDYNGKADQRVCLRIEMKDDEGNTHEQFFSAADPKHFAPSSDGSHIVAVSDKGSLVRGSNYDGFMSSLINAGFPEANLRQGIAAIVGTKVHVVRKPAPQRSGLLQQEGGREKTVLIVEKLISLPGKGGKAAAAGKAPAAAKTTPKAAAAEAESEVSELDSELRDFVLAEAKEAGDEGITRKKLIAAAMKKLTGATKKPSIQRLGQDEFFDAAMGDAVFIWDGDSQTVTAAE